MKLQDAAVKRGKTRVANKEIDNGSKPRKMQLANHRLDSGCPSSLRHDM